MLGELDAARNGDVINKPFVFDKELPASIGIAAKIGFDGKGLGGHTGYLERLARDNPDLFVNRWLRATLPPAREEDPANVVQGGIRDIIIQSVACGGVILPQGLAKLDRNEALSPEDVLLLPTSAELAAYAEQPSLVESEPRL